MSIKEERWDSLLAEASRPELFRANAFRILGLPVHATERQIKKHAERVRLAEKFGGAEEMQSSTALPLNPAPDMDAIREATHRLRNPELRVLDEFFWFWPVDSTSQDEDEAISALVKGDLKTATSVWYKQAEQPGTEAVAVHNIAVLYHATALDLEYLPDVKPLNEGLKKLQQAYWREAFTRWHMVIKDRAFWTKLEERIAEIDDPRLTADFASRLRDALPLVLVSINARLAVRALDEGEREEAERQRALMLETRFDEEVIDEALQRAVTPIVERIRSLCQSCEPEAEEDPQHADAVTRRLLEQAGAQLEALAVVLPGKHPLVEATRDEVASSALNCLIPFSQETGNWRAANTLLEQTRPYAVTTGVRERIDGMRAFLLKSAYA
jgi:hypothetical protein